MSTLTELLEDYYAARERYDELDSQRKRAYALMKQREDAVVERMLDDGITKLSRDDGTTPYLRNVFDCSVRQDNQDDIRAWLREVEGDDMPFVVERVDKPTLKEWLRARIEDGKLAQQDIPKWLNVKSRPELSVLGWKART